MPRPLLYITQLPEYKAQLLRQMEVLKVAEGFTAKDKEDLAEIYKMLLAKVECILADTGINHAFHETMMIQSLTFLYAKHRPGRKLLTVEAVEPNNIPVKDFQIVKE